MSGTSTIPAIYGEQRQLYSVCKYHAYHTCTAKRISPILCCPTIGPRQQWTVKLHIPNGDWNVVILYASMPFISPHDDPSSTICLAPNSRMGACP